MINGKILTFRLDNLKEKAKELSNVLKFISTI